MTNTPTEITYAGFWRRLTAMALDIIVLFPLTASFVYISHFGNKSSVIISYTLIVFLVAAYHILMPAKWGATLGKMALKIKIVKNHSFDNIGVSEAISRFSIETILITIHAATYIYTAAQLPHTFFGEGWLQSFGGIRDMLPHWALTIGHLNSLYMGSELAILLFNKKKRGIQDFIAGTVVVHTKSNKTNQKPSTLKRWAKRIAIIPLSILALLLVFGLMIEFKILREGIVLSGSEIRKKDVQTLIDYGIVQQPDKILYFYSPGLFSILSYGVVLTDSDLIIYVKDETKKVVGYTLPLKEITSIKRLEHGNAAMDSTYQINCINCEDMFQIELSSEKDGDHKFIEAIKSRMSKDQ